MGFESPLRYYHNSEVSRYPHGQRIGWDSTLLNELIRVWIVQSNHDCKKDFSSSGNHCRERWNLILKIAGPFQAARRAAGIKHKKGNPEGGDGI